MARRRTHTLTCTVTDSFLGRALGLMFSLRPRPLALSFPTERRIALHMWFVFFPIDVVFIDAQGTAVEIKEDFRPWTLYASHRPAMHAVEMPAGWVRARGIKRGDAVRFA